MKYFPLTVLFLTMIATSATAKSPSLAAKSMSVLSDVRDNNGSYGALVGDAKDFYNNMSSNKKSKAVKIEVLAAKEEFEDIDDVIANIEKDKLPAPKMRKKIVTPKSHILSFLDDKKNAAKNEALVETQENDLVSFPKPMLNPKREIIVAEKTEEPKADDIAEVLKEKEDTESVITTYIAPSVSDEEKKEIAEIIAEDAAWEEDWKKVSSINTNRDDIAFNKLLDDSFSFLPGDVPVASDEQKSKASKMITASDIEKMFGLDDKKSSNLPDFKIDSYSDGGSWQWPVDTAARQRISSKFGYRKHPVTGRTSFHKGVDIAAPRGTKVLASRSGKVELVTRHRYLGKYIKVRHKDGSYALYGHLSKRLARQGQRVSAGDVIGKVGSTGRSTGPHLDFSIRIKEKAVDPMKRLSVPSKLARR